MGSSCNHTRLSKRDLTKEKSPGPLKQDAVLHASETEEGEKAKESRHCNSTARKVKDADSFLRDFRRSVALPTPYLDFGSVKPVQTFKYVLRHQSESESSSVMSDSLRFHGLSMEFFRPEHWSG